MDVAGILAGMAVTQQLARVTAEYLAACRRSAAERDGDPRWDPPAAEVLDLDWAPAMLERVCEAGGVDAVRSAALRRSTGGGDAIEAGFLHGYPYGIGEFGPAPTALTADEVAEVAARLREIDLRAVLGAGNEALAALEAESRIVGGVRAYLLGHFDALCAFYAEAARRGLLVVLWWD